MANGAAAAEDAEPGGAACAQGWNRAPFGG